MDNDIKEMFELVVTKLDTIDKRLNDVEVTLKESNERQVLFENKVSKQVGALFDGYKQNLESNFELKQKIDKIS